MIRNMDMLRIMCEFAAVMFILPLCIIMKIRWFDALRNKGQRSGMTLTKESFLYAAVFSMFILCMVMFLLQINR